MAQRRLAERMQLVPVDEAVPDVPAPTGPDRPTSVATGVARWAARRWWVAAVAAVAAIAVAWQVGAAHDRAYVRRVAAVPGLVHPLDGAPSARWSAPAMSATSAVEAASGRLVVATAEAGQAVLVAHDLSTGERVWDRTLAGLLGGGTEGPDVACPSDGADVGSLVVCLVRPARSVYATADAGRSVPRTTVVPLAAADGSSVGRWSPDDPVFDAVRVGDDLVLVTYDDGRLTVTRHDAVDGTVRWVTQGSDRLSGSRPAPATTVALEGGLLVVHGPGTLVLEPSTGRVLLDAPAIRDERVVAVDDGVATWRIGTGWVLTNLDGTVRYRLPGAPAAAAVDDGSSSSLVVVDAGTVLRGIDADDGRALWSQPQVMNLVARVSGRLLAAGEDRWGVLDPGDGHVLWTAELGGPLPWLPLSDGALALGPGEAPDGSIRLDARHLSDGVRAWSLELPRGAVEVGVFAGRVVVRTADQVVVHG